MLQTVFKTARARLENGQASDVESGSDDAKSNSDDDGKFLAKLKYFQANSLKFYLFISRVF